MLNDFVDKTVKLMKKSDIQVRMPEYRRIEIGQTTTVFIECYSSICQTRLADNLIFHLMVFFSLLDSYIDSQYPTLDGYSFAQKYRELPTNDDHEVIIKEVYRILKIFRNASTHSRSAITVLHDTEIIADYQYRKTNFTLQMSKNSLELIYTVILLLLDTNEYSRQYLHGLLRTFYDDLKNEIIISDEFGQNNLANISSGVRLKRIVRYRITNPDYKIDTSTGLISIVRYTMHPTETEHYSCDYLIELNGKKYLIPNEVLNQAGEISIVDSVTWELKNIV